MLSTSKFALFALLAGAASFPGADCFVPQKLALCRCTFLIFFLCSTAVRLRIAFADIFFGIISRFLWFVSYLQTKSFLITFILSPSAAVSSSRIPVWAAEKEAVAIATEVDAEELSSQAVSMDGFNNIIGANGVAPNQPNERYKAISLQSLDKVVEKHPQLEPYLEDIRLAGLIFPFKASPYFVDELIEWEAEDLQKDPHYKLIFPTMDMLEPHHQEKLRTAKETGDPAQLIQTVADIRADLNPHPAGQKQLNAPKNDDLTGVQHKYSETVLVFPAAAQTCHAYCTYCFRWAQFIGDDELRFAQKEADSLFSYLGEHPEVSDILMTGGDPMVMKTKSLAQYLEPLTDPHFLPHIKNIRIGTRSLTFWPQRFTTDADADECIELLRRVREEGGRHVAIMAHLGHYRELQPQKFKDAVNRIQKEAFATIRSQSPIMRGINDNSEVWAEKWRTEVNLGIVSSFNMM